MSRTENLETARLIATAVVSPKFQQELLKSTYVDEVKSLKYQDEKFPLTRYEAEQIARAVLNAHFEGSPTLSQVVKNLAEYREADR